MELTIKIDDQLLQDIAQYEEDKTPEAVVSEALQEYLQYRRQLAVLDEFGKYDFDPEFDAKAARMQR
jgi:hypothetical protein